MQSESSGEFGSVVGATDTRGKHMISAELKRVEQDIRFLEVNWEMNFSDLYYIGVKKGGILVGNNCEELEELEKTDKASVACKEMLINIETRPDPLLPVTIGPINPTWDRWFEGAQESSGCRCWIL
ncbi:hypothetical protein CASFOL_029892 [Castilleja foliolosa]|uniref:G protein gamma domain-containing protein n=1 Tax=Castilleja foliolosa TaxID=1961234 RepID=A0ABD3C9U1_9LAMI